MILERHHEKEEELEQTCYAKTCPDRIFKDMSVLTKKSFKKVLVTPKWWYRNASLSFWEEIFYVSTDSVTFLCWVNTTIKLLFAGHASTIPTSNVHHHRLTICQPFTHHLSIKSFTRYPFLPTCLPYPFINSSPQQLNLLSFSTVAKQQ